MHRQASYKVAGLIVARDAARGAGRGGSVLFKVETGIVEFVFAEKRDVSVHEIFHPGQRIHTDFTIFRTRAELIGSLGKEYRRTRSSIDL